MRIVSKQVVLVIVVTSGQLRSVRSEIKVYQLDVVCFEVLKEKFTNIKVTLCITSIKKMNLITENFFKRYKKYIINYW